MRHRLIIDETLARGGDLHKLNEYAAIQINDTHPSMVIPEPDPSSDAAWNSDG